MTDIRERPILFSGEMVRAILDGRKTQTRRVVKPQPLEEYSVIQVGIYNPRKVDRLGEEYPGDPVFGAFTADGEYGWECPYGDPGSSLVLLCTWGTERRYDKVKSLRLPKAARIWSLFDGPKPGWVGRSRPGRFMPKGLRALMPKAQVLGVRVERVKEISEEDAKAEGVEPTGDHRSVCPTTCFRNEFAVLWNDLNAKRGYGWGTNPFCWVIEFTRVKP